MKPIQALFAFVSTLAVISLTGCSESWIATDVPTEKFQGKCYEAYSELSKAASGSKLGPDTALALALSETAASGNSKYVALSSGLDDGSLRSYVYEEENVLWNRFITAKRDGKCQLLFARTRDTEINSGGRRGRSVNYSELELLPDSRNGYSEAVKEVESTLKILLARESEKLKKVPVSGKTDEFDVLR